MQFIVLYSYKNIFASVFQAINVCLYLEISEILCGGLLENVYVASNIFKRALSLLNLKLLIILKYIWLLHVLTIIWLLLFIIGYYWLFSLFFSDSTKYSAVPF